MRSIPTLAVMAVLFACLVGSAAAKGKGGGGGKGSGGGKGFGGGGKQSVGGHGPKAGGPAAQKPAKHEPRKQPGNLAKDKTAKEHGSPRQPGEPTANKKEHQLQLFQQQRDKKLAQAEHLREIADRNGNANLAANADRMEAQALQQYAD